MQVLTEVYNGKLKKELHYVTNSKMKLISSKHDVPCAQADLVGFHMCDECCDCHYYEDV